MRGLISGPSLCNKCDHVKKMQHLGVRHDEMHEICSKWKEMGEVGTWKELQ
jgi:hypothetical protein